MSLLQNGTSGITKDEITNALGFKGNEADMNAYYKRIHEELPKRNANTTLKLANSIWTNTGVNPKPEYSKTATDFYYAHIEDTDFSNTETTSSINNWCSEATNGTINEIFTSGSLNANMKMVLINAIYFKSNWHIPFAPLKTTTQHFKGDKNYNVDLMDNTAEYALYFSNDFSMVEIDYKGGAYCMDILLPTKQSVADLVKTLDAETFNRAINNLTPTNTHLQMPRLKSVREIDLIKTMKSIGINKLFSADAEFDRLTDTEIFTDLIKQKVYIDIDEKGSESAGVTVIGNVTSGQNTDNKPTEFKVDRPYIIIIREKPTNIVMFGGVIQRP